MTAALAAICAFFAVFLLMAGARIIPRSRREPETRLRALRVKETQTETSATLMRRAPSSIPFLSNLLSGEWGERIRLQLERADLKLRPGEFVTMRVFLVSLALVAPLLLVPLPAGAVVGLFFGALAYILPGVYIHSRIARRTDAINEQLAEFLRLAANAMRAGFAFLQAVESGSRELQPPLSDELEKLILDTNLGANTDDSLRALADRVDTYEIRAMVTAILVQRGTGGNLAEVLDGVAQTMEERERIRGEVRSFTSQQRLTGNILSLYPLVLLAMFTAMHPSLMSLLWTDSIGLVLLAIGGTLQLTGFLVIRRILAVEY